MRFLIPPHGKLGDVRNESTAANLDNSSPVTTAALFAFFKLEFMNIGDEINVPDPASVVGAFSFEIIRLAIKTVAKDMGTIEDKFLVIQKVHHERRRSERNVARRLMAASVEMLEPRIQRDHEQTSSLPLKSLLGAALLPYCSCAAPLENVYEFLVDVALRRRFATRRNFTDVGVIHIPGAF